MVWSQDNPWYVMLKCHKILVFPWISLRKSFSQQHEILGILKMGIEGVFKGCVHYIFASLLFKSKREHL